MVIVPNNLKSTKLWIRTISSLSERRKALQFRSLRIKITMTGLDM
jgi:hypothetical protein